MRHLFSPCISLLQLSLTIRIYVVHSCGYFWLYFHFQSKSSAKHSLTMTFSFFWHFARLWTGRIGRHGTFPLLWNGHNLCPANCSCIPCLQSNQSSWRAARPIRRVVLDCVVSNVDISFGCTGLLKCLIRTLFFYKHNLYIKLITLEIEHFNRHS